MQDASYRHAVHSELLSRFAARGVTCHRCRGPARYIGQEGAVSTPVIGRWEWHPACSALYDDRDVTTAAAADGAAVVC